MDGEAWQAAVHGVTKSWTEQGHTHTHTHTIYCIPMGCVHAKLLSRVGLFVTPWTVTHQAPLSMVFSLLSSRGSSRPRD